MNNDSFLSDKGKIVAENTSRVDIEFYFEVMDNLYHATDNPEGAFPMNVAENQLCWNQLKKKIQEVTRTKDIPDWVAGYGDPAGVEPFREAIAKFMSDFIVKAQIDADTLAISGGATGVIEMTSFLLANPGDTAVIPAPSYPVYTADIGVIPDVNRYDLQTHQELSDLKNGIPISIDGLEKAKLDIEESGSRFRILILTSPDNPTGMIYSERQLREITEWCIKNEIHMIVNEIYGMSRIQIDHPELVEDYSDPITFYSFGQIMKEYTSPFLHYWYSFSKDFGISGFRIGVLHSLNQDLINGYKNAGLSHSISNHTQWIITEVLQDEKFLQDYFKNQSAALTQAYLTVRNALNEVGINFNPSYGSLFVWMDLSNILTDESSEGETALWKEIYDSTKILITPADGFGHSKKGLFRLVITSLKPEELKVAMERLKGFIRKRIS